MRNNYLFIWQLGAIIFSIVLGTLLHFLYEWSGENSFVALFSAVNESTWEHLKIAFVPMIIFSIIESFFIKNNLFWQAKAIGILVTLCIIIVLFYTYTGILGYSISPLNIIIFIISIIIGESVAYFIISGQLASFIKRKSLSVILLTVLMISFIIFTRNPVEINLFRDPITGQYGILE